MTSFTGRITLYCTTQGWMTDLGETHQADEVYRLFNTTQLPTPYTATADPADVLRDVAARNARATVVVRG